MTSELNPMIRITYLILAIADRLIARILIRRHRRNRQRGARKIASQK